MNEKSVVKEKLTYGEELAKELKELKDSAKRIEFDYHQIQGAIKFAESTLKKYNESLNDDK